jgi:hypothetical protein
MGRWRAILFGVGDCLFLIVVGVVATMTMHHAHEVIGGFVFAMFLGMAAAMLVQMMLAFLVAPLLGSIESMAPSMVVAMISPMSVCALHLIGFEPLGGVCALVGAAFGAAMFVFTLAYGVRCRRALAEAYRHA